LEDIKKGFPLNGSETREQVEGVLKQARSIPESKMTAVLGEMAGTVKKLVGDNYEGYSKHLNNQPYFGLTSAVQPSILP
jgi:hypothetical protein